MKFSIIKTFFVAAFVVAGSLLFASQAFAGFEINNPSSGPDNCETLVTLKDSNGSGHFPVPFGCHEDPQNGGYVQSSFSVPSGDSIYFGAHMYYNNSGDTDLNQMSVKLNYPNSASAGSLVNISTGFFTTNNLGTLGILSKSEQITFSKDVSIVPVHLATAINADGQSNGNVVVDIDQAIGSGHSVFSSSGLSIGNVPATQGYENGSVLVIFKATDTGNNNGGGGNNYDVDIEACENGSSSSCTRNTLDVNDGDDIELVWDINGNPDYCVFDSNPTFDSNWNNDTTYSYSSNGSDSIYSVNYNDAASNGEVDFTIKCYDNGSRVAQDSVTVDIQGDNNGGGNDSFNITTLDPSSLTRSSAKFRGEVGGQNNVDTWFEWGTSYNAIQNGSGSVYNVSGSFDNNDLFSKIRSGLQESTTYYYRACGQTSSYDDCGSIKSFTTRVDSITPPVTPNNPSTPFTALTQFPQVITLTATNITSSSATLLGAFDANGCNEFTTYFRLGKSPSQMFVQTESKFVGNTKGPVNGFAQNAYGTFYYELVGAGCGYTVTGGVKSFFTSKLPGAPVTPVITRIVTEKDTKEIIRVGGNDCVDLDVSNGIDKDVVYRGEQVAYKVQWEHRCVEDFENAILRVELSPGMDFISTERGQYTGKDEHAIVLQLNDLAAGEREEFDFMVTINNGADFNVSVEAVMALDYKESETENDTSQTVIGYDIDNVIENQNLFGASIFQSGFFTTPWGWLVTLLMLLGLGMFARYLYVAGRTQSAPAYAYPQPVYAQYPPQQRPVQYVSAVAQQPMPAAHRMVSHAPPAPPAKTFSATTATTKSSAPVDLPTDVGNNVDNSNDYQLYRPKPLD